MPRLGRLKGLLHRPVFIAQSTEILPVFIGKTTDRRLVQLTDARLVETE